MAENHYVPTVGLGMRPDENGTILSSFPDAVDQLLQFLCVVLQVILDEGHVDDIWIQLDNRLSLEQLVCTAASSSIEFKIDLEAPLMV